jgi:hypothetical protein
MNDRLPASGRTLSIPKAVPKSDDDALVFDMSLIDEAERRMPEIRLVSTATAKELGGLFNQACNQVGKLLNAEKEHNLNRANVILGKAMDEAAKYKAAGMKMNEDIREALIARDEACAHSLDIWNALKAAKVLFEGYKWTYIRAYASADENAKGRSQAPAHQLNGTVGQTFDVPQANFMGQKKGGFGG